MKPNIKKALELFEKESKKLSEWIHERRVLYGDRQTYMWGNDPLDERTDDGKKLSTSCAALGAMKQILGEFGLGKKVRTIEEKYSWTLPPHPQEAEARKKAIARLRAKGKKLTDRHKREVFLSRLRECELTPDTIAEISPEAQKIIKEVQRIMKTKPTGGRLV